MGNWRDKVQVKKGNIGENIVKKYLEDKGYIVYIPETDGGHSFDMLAIKNKKEVIIAEVKTKAKLSKYNGTGFDRKHYDEYNYISKKHSLRVFIFFVDEMLGEVYGNFLDELESFILKEWKYSNIIIFSMNGMIRNLYKLSDDDINLLKNLSTRNYDYKI